MKTHVKTSFSSPNRQKGVALMMVIFVFSLVTILAVGMYNRQGLFIKQAANMNAHIQAYQYGLAAETFAIRLLKDDWDEDKKNNEFVDDLAQVESSVVSPFTEVGIEGQLNDVHGKLNINDLVKLDGTINQVMVDRFQRLLSRLAINSIKVQALIDWIDENDDSQPNALEGAEDGEYLGLDVPYRTAGQPFNNLTELRLMFRLEQEEYEKLSEFVTVLPRGKGHINVNTASAEVLQAISGITDQQAEDLVSARESKDDSRWANIQDFSSESALSGSQLDTTHLQVYSLFFESASRITLGDRVVRLTSLIHREQSDGTMVVLSRDQGKKFVITKKQQTLTP